jgi:phosphoheptose isomerase
MSRAEVSPADLSGELVSRHLEDLATAGRVAQSAAAVVPEWGHHLAQVFADGGKLLACGNGGSAAEAHHLTGELLGRLWELNPSQPGARIVCVALNKALQLGEP